jgi:hypothetical protein
MATISTGELKVYKNRAITNTKIEIKDKTTRIHKVRYVSRSAAITIVQLFNKRAADVTVGTTVPDLEFPCLASSGFTEDLLPNGFLFGTALTIAVTALDGSSAPASTGLLTLTYI